MSRLAELLERRVLEARRAKRLLALVAEDFSHDLEACCRRYAVHAAVAKRLNVSVSNALILELQGALSSLEGFHKFTRSGRGFYRGLRMKREELADVPRPNQGRVHRRDEVEANRLRALDREARRRAERT